MQHFPLKLGLALPLLGTLGLILTQAVEVELAHATSESSVRYDSPMTGGDSLPASITLASKIPCSVAETRTEPKTPAVEGDMETVVDEPFYITWHSLHFVDRTTAETPVQHFTFFDSSAMRITAGKGPIPPIADNLRPRLSPKGS